MKKLKRARLLGDVIRRTLIEFTPKISENYKFDFDEYGAFKISEWVSKQENICALTIYDDQNGEKTISKVFAVAIDLEGPSIDFHVEGGSSDNEFSDYDNYFHSVAGGKYTLPRVANVLQDEFGIPAQQFLNELEAQAEIVREEHKQQKQAKRTLRTLGY